MTRSADPAQRRQQILIALFQVIHDRGIDGVSMRTLARAANVSVGAVQHHFGSRDELILEGCRFIIEAAEDAHELRSSHAAPLEVVRSIVAAPIPTMPQFRVGITVWFAYLAKVTSQPEIGELLRETADGTQRETARLLESAGVPNPEQTAVRLLALADGLAQRVLIGSVSPQAALDLVDAELAALEVSA